VNVGCIPKKMMHYAGILSEARADMAQMGWEIDQNQRADWTKMVKHINQHIRSLNWGFKAELMKAKAKYFNEYASFIDAHTLELKKANGDTQTVTADKIVIACGGRPSYPEIPGAREFGITSDDIFSQ